MLFPLAGRTSLLQPHASFLKGIVEEFHARGMPLCSIPFEGCYTEEVGFRLFDGFSSDCLGVCSR